MSMTGVINLQLTATEIVDTGLHTVGTSTSLLHTLGALRTALNANTTPAVDSGIGDKVALVAGSATLDLAALAKGNFSGSKDFSDKSVKAYALKAASTNTDTLTIETGASNGYDLFGQSGSDQVTLSPGDTIAFLAGDNDSLETIDATHKTIDLSSSDVDAELEYLILVG